MKNVTKTVRLHRLLVRTAYKRIYKMVKVKNYLVNTTLSKKQLVAMYCEMYGITFIGNHNDFMVSQYQDANSPIGIGKKLPVFKSKKKKIKSETLPNGYVLIEGISHREQYKAYLKSKEWRLLKSRITESRGKKCENCGVGGCLDGHHVTYQRLFNELPEDIMMLCRKCHKLEHKKLKSQLPQP